MVIFSRQGRERSRRKVRKITQKGTSRGEKKVRICAIGSELLISGGVEPGMGLHAGLDALAAEEEAGGVGVIGGVGVVALDPLAAGDAGVAAEGAGVGAAAVFERELVGEPGVFFGFTAALGGLDFMGEVVLLEPLVEGLDFVLGAELDPRAHAGVEEEPGIFEALLDEGIGPGGDLDHFACRHAAGYTARRCKTQRRGGGQNGVFDKTV